MARKKKDRAGAGDPGWYRDAVIYEVHPRAFCDSDGDGIGDFRGLASKLDYLQGLGVTAIWLLPFFPSPLRDDGYDTADYTGVHPSYGTMRDFKAFLREAHKRGLKVITELVLNHTSDQHPWFQKARRAKPGSKWRDFYVWSDNAEKYPEARIIFQDFETSNWTWDPVAKAYYWHRFYSHQPDLNFDNPRVARAMFKVIDFWLDMGVDGVRLDAVPYLFEREGTNCENLPETYDFLRALRAHVDEKYDDRMLLAEANQWPEDASAYFGDGDMCHMAFHFPIMPRLFMALRMEDRFPIIDILEQTPAIPDNCQWALFLRNHDELTLEMVTDEERDYMYRVFAVDPRMRVNVGIRRRLAPLMGRNRRTIELLNALLLSLPGTPVLYYGDEIGMGDNFYLGDRNAVRTPMQWSSDRNAGFSRANPQSLYLPVIIDPEYHFETVNVEAQDNNPHSLLWWTRRIISLRKRHKAFGRGDIRFLTPDNRKVLAFVRSHGRENILVVANLSRFTQFAELDLSEYADMVPVECFGQTRFPQVGHEPYTMTMGPHSFYWFSLEPARAAEATTDEAGVPRIMPECALEEIMDAEGRTALEKVLPRFLALQPWTSGGTVVAVHIEETLRVSDWPAPSWVLLVRARRERRDEILYSVPLALARGPRAEALKADAPHSVAACVVCAETGRTAVLFDALADPGFCKTLVESMPRRRGGESGNGLLAATRTRAYGQVTGEDPGTRTPAALVGHNNTVLAFGDRFLLKFFRRLEPDINPELEMGRFLAEAGFAHAPRLAGAIEYRRGRRRHPMTLAVLSDYMPHQGTAWELALDTLSRILEDALSDVQAPPPEAAPGAHLLDAVETVPPVPVLERMSPFLESAAMLGRRMAQLHETLASGRDNPDFAPERFTKLYLRSLRQAMRSHAARTFLKLERVLPKLPPKAAQAGAMALEIKDAVKDFSLPLAEKRFHGSRIRIHGQMHLGHALLLGNDFMFIDFEGDPWRPFGERRIKRSPLRDVAAMLGSLHGAAFTAMQAATVRHSPRPEDLSRLDAWASAWRFWSGASFLRAYLSPAISELMPAEPEDLSRLLDIYRMDMAVVQLEQELDHRPAFTALPVARMVRLLEAAGNGSEKT